MHCSDQMSYKLNDTDGIEINEFPGLLMYSAVFKSNQEEDGCLFATDISGREIFRCVT